MSFSWHRLPCCAGWGQCIWGPGSPSEHSLSELQPQGIGWLQQPALPACPCSFCWESCKTELASPDVCALAGLLLQPAQWDGVGSSKGPRKLHMQQGSRTLPSAASLPFMGHMLQGESTTPIFYCSHRKKTKQKNPQTPHIITTNYLTWTNGTDKPGINHVSAMLLACREEASSLLRGDPHWDTVRGPSQAKHVNHSVFAKAFSTGSSCC